MGRSYQILVIAAFPMGKFPIFFYEHFLCYLLYRSGGEVNLLCAGRSVIGKSCYYHDHFCASVLPNIKYNHLTQRGDFLKKKKILLMISALMLGLSLSVPSALLVGPVKPVITYAATTSLAKCTTTLSNTSGGVKASWNKVSGASGYEFYRKDGTGSYSLLTKISSGSTTSFTDSTAKGGTTYSYYVVAKNSSSTSSYAADTIVRLENVKPSLLNTATGVKVSWDKVSGATGYKVYRKVSGTTSYSCIKTISSGSTLSYVDTTAESGTKYNYYVRSTNGSDQSGYDSSVIVRLENPAVTVFNASDGVSIQWNKIDGAAGYKVFRKESGGSYSCIKTISSGDTLKYVDPTAESGTKYNYYVRSTNGSYQSGYASKVIVRLDTPTVSASNSYQGLKVSWSKISGATGYKIYRKPSGGSYTCIKTITDASTLVYYDAEAKSGTKYNYYVRSTNGSYQSGYASKAILVVSAPEISLTSTADGVNISWNKITGATSYQIYRKTGTGSYSNIKTISSGNNTFYTDTTVKTGNAYTYYVKAYNGTKSSGYSSEKITYKYEADLVMDLVVKDGKVTDLVTGTEYPDITVSGDYMKAGTITLPKSYSNWTYQMIADYNESSSQGIIKQMKFTSNSGKYEECSNVFRLNEVSAISNRGSVVVPWVKDSWNSGYVVTIPVQIYSHVSADYEYLPTGDVFWSFSMDSDNGVLNSRIDGATATTTMSTYTASDGSTKYVSKILPSSFALTGEHAVKEIKIYDKAQSVEEQKVAYEESGIIAPKSGINDIVDGLTDMGSSLYFTREKGGYVTPLKSETEAGTYTVEDGNGRKVSYEIKDFVQPDNSIDNSAYESVHITNEPETLETGKQYPLTAYPYPYNITGSDGKADEFDVEWSSSNNDVITFIDGLLIAKKAGTAKITATLMGTDMSDTVTIKVENPEKVTDKVWNVPSNYISKDGYSFSDSDYEMTTRAIYAAIDEAAENGYNHIVFPKQNFYAVPLTDKDGYAVRYYVPTNMTIEFPEGSAFYMMDNEVSRGDPTKIELHYFEFGVPANDYTNTCEDSHLIIDTYYGERYKTTHSESEYLEELRFVNFGRKAINCSVEIRNANYPAGYFIVADGTSSTNKNTGVMTYGDFVSGWLDEDGQLQENSNWISTSDFITVPDYGEDGYFISADGQDSYAGKYWGGCSARQYDILWYDSNKELISADRFQGRGEYYDIPTDAAYFKLSLQQSTLPTPGSNETEDSPWIAMHDDGSAKMCEIKNTNVYNSATGVFSVVGETDGLWIHDCYTNRNGMKPADERTGDFENGWTAMRHSVVSHNSFNGYFGNPGGFNTFIHTNYLTNYSGFSGETEMLRYINNTTDYVEISEKAQAHIYNNTLYGVGVDRFNTSIGHIYQQNNKTGQWVRSY